MTKLDCQLGGMGRERGALLPSVSHSLWVAQVPSQRQFSSPMDMSLPSLSSPHLFPLPAAWARSAQGHLSLISSFLPSFSHLFNYSLTYSPIQLSILPTSHPSTHPPIHPPVRPSVHPPIPKLKDRSKYFRFPMLTIKHRTPHPNSRC